MNARDITVLYICGHEHSGSTILDLHLQQHPQIVSVGEANRLEQYLDDVSNGGNARTHCRCGAIFKACPFWGEVRKEASRLGRPLESMRFLTPDEGFGEACEVFYRAVATVTHATTIVDSSKGLRRLMKLQSETRLRIIPIHVTRGLYSYLASHKKRVDIGHREVARLSIKYLVLNRQIRRQIRHGPHVSLRFEDFVARREAALALIARAAGLDPLWSGDRDDGPQSPVHNLGGNRLLRAGREQLSSTRAAPVARILPSMTDAVLRGLSRTVDVLDRTAMRLD